MTHIYHSNVFTSALKTACLEVTVQVICHLLSVTSAQITACPCCDTSSGPSSGHLLSETSAQIKACPCCDISSGPSSGHLLSETSAQITTYPSSGHL